MTIKTCKCGASLEGRHHATVYCEPCRAATRKAKVRIYSQTARDSIHGKVDAKAYAKTPRAKYCKQKNHAKTRGIPFNLTFEEWWEMWEPHFRNRGKNVTNLMMCRTGDTGAYEVGNVRLDTPLSNQRERHL
tara:strand:+ start:4809 stop:5204 length:396 start_codon:yes stop_codon:yes gene_type:complete